MRKSKSTPRPGVSPLRCPRCGASMGYLERGSKKNHFVRCAKCRHKGPIEDTPAEAVYGWNRLPRN